MEFTFVHIPRTGGTTFGRILETHFDGVIHDDGDPKNPTRFEDYPIIWGHFVADKYKHLNRPLISFLRDPVERAISDYYFFHYAFPGLNVREHAKKRCNRLTKYIKDINDFAFIGIQEHYEQSLSRFEQWSGKTISRDYVSCQVNRDKKPVSVADREYIRELHESDYRIYNEALRRLK